LIDGLLYLQDFISKDEEEIIKSELNSSPWQVNDGGKFRKVKQYGYAFNGKNITENVLTKLNDDPFDQSMPQSCQSVISRLEHMMFMNKTVATHCSGESSCDESSSSSSSQPSTGSFNIEQCIVNDYTGSQGIKTHFDRRCFGEYIVLLSLGYDDDSGACGGGGGGGDEKKVGDFLKLGNGIKQLQPDKKNNDEQQKQQQPLLHSSCVVMDFIHMKTKEIRAMLVEPRSVIVLSGEARNGWLHGIGAFDSHCFRGKVIKREGSRVRRTSVTFRSINDRSVITK
jgi:hypothetical protein